VPEYLANRTALTLFDIGYDTLTAIENAARTDRQDLALLRFFLRGIGQHDAALGNLLAVEWLYNHPVARGRRLRLAMCCPSGMFLGSRVFAACLALGGAEC